MQQRRPSEIWYHPVAWLAFGCGAGLIPVMPGTFGTAFGVLLFWCCPDLTPFHSIILLMVMFDIGIFLCEQTDKMLGTHDHSSIVYDEVVGFFITMFALPKTLFFISAGFVLFRFFDILKPWPISWCDKNIKGGFGVMFDDVLAAVAANVVLRLICNYYF